MFEVMYGTQYPGVAKLSFAAGNSYKGERENPLAVVSPTFAYPTRTFTDLPLSKVNKNTRIVIFTVQLLSQLSASAKQR